PVPPAERRHVLHRASAGGRTHRAHRRQRPGSPVRPLRRAPAPGPVPAALSLGPGRRGRPRLRTLPPEQRSGRGRRLLRPGTAAVIARATWRRPPWAAGRLLVTLLLCVVSEAGCGARAVRPRPTVGVGDTLPSVPLVTLAGVPAALDREIAGHPA